MVEVKVFKDGEMINQTKSAYAVVFSGAEEGDGIGAYGEFRITDLAATLCTGTVECVAVACRESGADSLDHLAIINAISMAIRKQGHERILAEIIEEE